MVLELSLPTLIPVFVELTSPFVVTSLETMVGLIHPLVPLSQMIVPVMEPIPWEPLLEVWESV
jgi:hypothetical protein